MILLEFQNSLDRSVMVSLKEKEEELQLQMILQTQKELNTFLVRQRESYEVKRK